MSIDKVLIVGDIFEEYRKTAEGVMLYSEFVSEVAELGPAAFAGMKIVPGQGLSDAELDSIATVVRQAGGGAIFEKRADRALTHKHELRNIMITEPEEAGERLYRSELRVDGRCAEMSDHRTGLHLQGMVLVEACRQMLVAATEKFLLPREREHRYSFVFDRMDTRFIEFAFPFGAEVALDVIDSSSRGDLLYKFAVQMKVIQSGRELFRMDAGYSVMSRDYIEFKEAKLAKAGTEQFLKGA